MYLRTPYTRWKAWVWWVLIRPGLDLTGLPWTWDRFNFILRNISVLRLLVRALEEPHPFEDKFRSRFSALIRGCIASCKFIGFLSRFLRQEIIARLFQNRRYHTRVLFAARSRDTRQIYFETPSKSNLFLTLNTYSSSLDRLRLVRTVLSYLSLPTYLRLLELSFV